MKDFTITFPLRDTGLPHLPGALDSAFNGETLVIFIWYTSHKAPLMLMTPGKTLDTVRLTVRAHRIEVYVNDILTEEEWPWGEPCLTREQLSELGASYDVPDAPAWTPETITDIQNWKPEGSVFVGDCMPFCCDDTLHVFYLKDRHHHYSKWLSGAHQWAHIMTRDLINWETCPMAVEIDDPAEGSVCTGSVIRFRDRYYAFYAIRSPWGDPARLSCSVSDDCIHFEKTDLDIRLEAPYDAPSARDPHVFVGDDGRVHMLVTTSITREDGTFGCLAELASADLVNWTDLGPNVVYTDGSQPECADCFRYGDYWYRLYSIGGTAHYDIGKSAAGPWTPSGETIGHNPQLCVPKAAVWHGRLIFVGFDRIDLYAGSMHVMEAFPNPDGRLRIEELRV